jgi:hypothetical protein
MATVLLIDHCGCQLGAIDKETLVNTYEDELFSDFDQEQSDGEEFSAELMSVIEEPEDAGEVEEDEDEYLASSNGWGREFWSRSLGMNAFLHSAEEE